MHRIRLFCPNCKQEVEADRLDAGRLISCPKCSKTLRVPEADVQPGTQIGSYIVLRHLGSGGMGDVWLAKHTTMDRKVAIKVLSTKYLSNKEFIDRFLHEIRLLAKLNHPNIVTAYDAGAYKGIYYLVMNYIEGKELDVVINQKGKLPEFNALLITTYLADALAYAWNSFKIIHRDIKPGNIIIDSNGKPYLMDLGISKSFSDDSSAVSLHTKTGIFGTPHFMSPEQVRGEKNISFKSDIYALGATLFVMLTATYPYDGDNPFIVANKQLTEPVPSPKRFNPLISSETNALVKKMMAKNPSDRFDSWESVIAAIEQIANASTNSKATSADSANTIKTPTLTQSSSSETLKKPTLLNYQKPKVGFIIEQKPLKVIPIEENSLQKEDFKKNKIKKNDFAVINQKKISPNKRTNVLLFVAIPVTFTLILSVFGIIFYLRSERNKKNEITPQFEKKVLSSEQNPVSQKEIYIESNSNNTIKSTTKNNTDELQKSIIPSSYVAPKIDSNINIPPDHQVLKQIADTFSIPYPPPQPLKSIPEVEDTITVKLNNLNSTNESYDQKLNKAREKVLQKMNISTPPTYTSKTIKQLEEENSIFKENYIKNKLSADFPEIFQERARLEDETKNISPVCSLAEAKKRFDREIEKLFYIEIRKRGLPSPLGINLSNEKKIQELSPIYKDIIEELKIQHAASFYKKLGFFVITTDKNSYPYIFNEAEHYIEKKLQIFVQRFIKDKPAYSKLVSEAEQKYPIEDYLKNNGYFKFDGEWKPAYELYKALLDEELRCFPIQEHITLQDQVNKIREKVYTENNYIFYDQEWITYEDFLNRQVQKLNSIGISDDPPYWVLKYVYELENLMTKNEEQIWELIVAHLLSTDRNLSKNFLISGIAYNIYYNHIVSEVFSTLSNIDHSKLNSIREALTYNNFPEALKIANTFPQKLSKNLINIINKYKNNISPNIRNRPDIIWSCSQNGTNCYWDQMQQKWKESRINKQTSPSQLKADRPDQYKNLRSENLDYNFQITNENVFTSMLFVPGEYELALPEIEISVAEIQINGDLFENPQLILILNPNTNSEKIYEFRLINTAFFCTYLFNFSDFLELKKNIQSNYEVCRICVLDKNFIDLFSNYENWKKFLTWQGKLFGQDISVINQNSNLILGNALQVNKLYTFNLDKYGIKIFEGSNKIISVSNLPVQIASFDYVFQSGDNSVNNLSVTLRYDFNYNYNVGTGNKFQITGTLGQISLNHLTDSQPNLIIPNIPFNFKTSDSVTTFIRDYLQNKIERPPIKTKIYMCKNYKKFNFKITPNHVPSCDYKEPFLTLYISPENSNDEVSVPMKLSPIGTYFSYKNFDIDITDKKLMSWFDKIIKLAHSENQNTQIKKCSIEFDLFFMQDLLQKRSSFSIRFSNDLRFNLCKRR